jgi:putative ABC transport system permease protein
MTLPRGWRRYFSIGKANLPADVEEELSFHLEMRIQEYLAAGLDPRAAQAEALRRFGDVEEVRRACRRIDQRQETRSRRREWRLGLFQDLGYAVRSLLRTPGLTLAILLTLALGIGANTAIFTVVNGVLLRALPFAAPDRLMSVYDVFTGLDLPYSRLSEPELIDLEGVPAFAMVAGHRETRRTLTGAGEPERLSVLLTTATFARVLGAPPPLGRYFGSDEDRPGAPAVAVLEHTCWLRRFAGDSSVIGRPIMLNGVPHTVIGVMPRGFAFGKAELFVPLALDRESPQDRTGHYLYAIARLRNGVGPTAAGTQLRTLVDRLKRDFPEAYPANMGFSLAIEPVADTMVGAVRPALLILLGAVGLLLLVACANVANLLLVRAEGRRRELAVRSALGAGRARLVRQLLTEGVVLALAGGVLGLLLAAVGVPALLAIAPESLPRHEGIAIDRVVCAVTFGLAVMTGIMFGLVPALQATRLDLQSSLKDGGHQGGVRARGRLRHTLVVAEVALAVVLVVGASLLMQSFWRLRQTDLGFRADGVLTLDLSLPERRYSDTTHVVGFYSALFERLRSLAGVSAVGAIANLPLSGTSGNWDIEIEGRRLAPGEPAPSPNVNMASPGYYAALRVPLIRGRALAPTDDERAPPVAVINQTMARRLWPGTDPVGRRFKVFADSTPWMTIVGVSRDIRSWGLTSEPRMEYTMPLSQLPVTLRMVRRSVTVVLRTAGDPLALAGPARREIAALDRDLAVANLRSLEQVVSDSVGQRRFTMLLLVLFGGVALALAVIGIYGVTAYGVAQRSREMGIRLALGAGPGAVRRLVVRQGMGLAVVGVSVGLLLAVIGTRALRSQLYGVRSTDPVTYLVLSALLLLVALLATDLPARRATRVDPLVTLRAE